MTFQLLAFHIFLYSKTKLGRNATFMILNIFYDFQFISKYKMASRPIMLSDWLKFLKSYSPLRLTISYDWNICNKLLPFRINYMSYVAHHCLQSS
jgi:hypothetical protein